MASSDEEETIGYTLRLSVQNATPRLRIVVFEPWGREFLLTLNEKLEVLAWVASEGPDLRVVESSNRTLVFVAGCSEVRVIKGGVTHNLEPIVEAAVVQAPLTRTLEDPLWDRDLDG
jgi:hypothetical protein